jgi:post-segregation antitoxin (ccd killing protein)
LSEVVTAKVPRELKERARRHGINISGLVRSALKAEVERVEERELRKEMDEISASLKKKLSEKDVVTAVRETREEH